MIWSDDGDNIITLITDYFIHVIRDFQTRLQGFQTCFHLETQDFEPIKKKVK